uniref:Ribosomal protein S14 n=1 Tax=Spumella sp. NIES-1846 TaxID=2490549 RepID=A0A455REI3_9STRA|nr:ribosomal protein S14 [Spumella sp. NIES-1846]
MIRLAKIEKFKNQKKIIIKYKTLRNNLFQNSKKVKTLLNYIYLIKKFEELPKNSSFFRLRNYCWKTGKTRGIYRFFGLCRNVIREFAYNNFLPGIIKSSW